MQLEATFIKFHNFHINPADTRRGKMSLHVEPMTHKFCTITIVVAKLLSAFEYIIRCLILNLFFNILGLNGTILPIISTALNVKNVSLKKTF